jgi:hypothetical protein
MGGWIEEVEGLLLPLSKLRFADLSKIPPENIIWRFSISDPADKGGDKFSTPFIHVAQMDGRIVCFVKDVIHSTDGIEANTERILSRIIDNGIEVAIYESNGVGLAAIMTISKQLPKNVKLVPHSASIQKETRILSHYEFVQKFFVFDANYKANKEYTAFISDLTSYLKDGDNKHKADAIDVMCAAAHMVKLRYHKIIYGN